MKTKFHRSYKLSDYTLLRLPPLDDALVREKSWNHIAPHYAINQTITYYYVLYLINICYYAFPHKCLPFTLHPHSDSFTFRLQVNSLPYNGKQVPWPIFNGRFLLCYTYLCAFFMSTYNIDYTLHLESRLNARIWCLSAFSLVEFWNILYIFAEPLFMSAFIRRKLTSTEKRCRKNESTIDIHDLNVIFSTIWLSPCPGTLPLIHV
jgi:hypothetical protein